MSRRPTRAEDTPTHPAASVPVVAQPAAVAPLPVLTFFFFGALKDGRHVAAEMDVQGKKALALRPLSASLRAEGVAKVWQQAAFLRQVQRRPYSAHEAEANARDGHGVTLRDVTGGAAVGLVTRGTKVVAVSVEVDGESVTEPKVLAHGAREFCWLEALLWAERNILPRRRR